MKDKDKEKWTYFAIVIILVLVIAYFIKRRQLQEEEDLEISELSNIIESGVPGGSISGATSKVSEEPYYGAASDASTIKSAGCYAAFGVCVSWSNEETVLGVLEGKTLGQLKAIETEFRKIYPAGLDAWIRSNFAEKKRRLIYERIEEIRKNA